MTISTVDRLRLAALLGMLGSNHVGERENAAQLVEQFRRQKGLVWSDLLGRQLAHDRPGGPEAHPSRPPPPLDDGFKPIGAAYRVQDVVWRWSMMLGLAVVGLMSLTSLAQYHAAQKHVADAGCQGAGCAARSAKAGDPAPWPPAGPPAASRKPFLQGLADRKIFEAWRATAPPGLCSGRADRKEWTSDCVIARKLLAQFDQRRRTDPGYRAGWNSLAQ